jgi:hypothetical protein
LTAILELVQEQLEVKVANKELWEVYRLERHRSRAPGQTWAFNAKGRVITKLIGVLELRQYNAKVLMPKIEAAGWLHRLKRIARACKAWHHPKRRVAPSQAIFVCDRC